MSAAAAEDSKVWSYHPAVITDAKSVALYTELSAKVDVLPQKSTMVWGRLCQQKRKVGYYSKTAQTYIYSGATHTNAGWNDTFEWLSQKAREIAKTDEPFDSALVNHYRTGSDGVAEHRDKDAMEGTIVSFSFYPSATSRERDFVIKHDITKKRTVFSLGQGSAFVMKPGMQQTHKHSLPERKTIKSGRVNVTMRQHQASKPQSSSTTAAAKKAIELKQRKNRAKVKSLPLRSAAAANE